MRGIAGERKAEIGKRIKQFQLLLKRRPTLIFDNNEQSAEYSSDSLTDVDVP